MAAHLDALAARIAAITNTYDIGESANIGSYVQAPLEYEAMVDGEGNTYPAAWGGDGVSRGLLVMRIVTRATRLGVTILTVFRADTPAVLLSNPGTEAGVNVIELEKGIYRAAVVILRAAGSSARIPLAGSDPVRIVGNELIKAYATWKSETTDALIVQTIKANRRSIPTTAPIEIKNASMRLCGRGWTGMEIILDLARRCVTVAAATEFNKLFSAYTGEVSCLVGTLEYIAFDKDRYMYSFYTGNSEVMGAKHYLHLSAIAYRATMDSTFRAYDGGFKHCKLPEEVLARVERLKELLIKVEMSDTPLNYLGLAQAMAAKYNGALTPQTLIRETLAGVVVEDEDNNGGAEVNEEDANQNGENGEDPPHQ